jgi:putative transposase
VRARFGVEPIYTTLGVSASACSQRATGRRSQRSLDDQRLLGLTLELRRRNYYAYGSWPIRKALGRAGEQVGRGQVERLMRTHGIQGAKRRGKPWRTIHTDTDARRLADLAEREFSAATPGDLWFADFSLRCWEGVSLCSFVIDAYSRAVVGWQIPSHARTDLVFNQRLGRPAAARRTRERGPSNTRLGEETSVRRLTGHAP